jgi:hypothetical protein
MHVRPISIVFRFLQFANNFTPAPHEVNRTIASSLALPS